MLNANKALQRKDSEMQAQKDALRRAREQEARAAQLEEQLAKERARAKELEERVQALQGRVAEGEKQGARAEALAAELDAAKGREAALVVGGDGPRPAAPSPASGVWLSLFSGPAPLTRLHCAVPPQEGLGQFRAKADSTSADLAAWMKRANDAEAVRAAPRRARVSHLFSC